MATPAASVQTVHLDILTNYLVSMARTVELAVDRALTALLQAGSPESRQAPGEIFLLEPRVNEMEMSSTSTRCACSAQACRRKRFVRSWPPWKSPTIWSGWAIWP